MVIKSLFKIYIRRTKVVQRGRINDAWKMDVGRYHPLNRYLIHQIWKFSGIENLPNLIETGSIQFGRFTTIQFVPFGRFLEDFSEDFTVFWKIVRIFQTFQGIQFSMLPNGRFFGTFCKPFKKMCCFYLLNRKYGKYIEFVTICS